MAFRLRPYQTSAVEAVLSHWAQGIDASLLVAPTGAGKTAIGSALISECLASGLRVLWLAHRGELIDQAYAALKREGVPEIGVVSATHAHLFRPYAPVQIAMMQTLLARGQLPQAGVIFLDEAHHYPNDNTWGAFLERYQGARRVGLTATPEGEGGRSLGTQYKRLHEVASMRWLTDNGYLVPLRVVTPEKNLKSNLAQDPVDAWFRYECQGRPTIVFARSIQHGTEIEAGFRARGTWARFVDAKTPSLFRAKAIEDLGAKRLEVLINVGLFLEGVDVPPAEVCVFAAAFQSYKKMAQGAGRVVRPFEGKKESLLIDLPGCVHLHGLPDDDRVFSLEGTPIRRKDPTIQVAQCPRCDHAFPPCDECPRCGYDLKMHRGTKASRPEVTGDELKEAREVLKQKRLEAKAAKDRKRAEREEKAAARDDRAQEKIEFRRFKYQSRTMTFDERLAMASKVKERIHAD